MLCERIDHLIVPIENLDSAIEPFRRLGLAFGPLLSHPSRGTESATFGAGDEASLFQVELTCIVDPDVSLRVRGRAAHEAVELHRPIALVLGTEDLEGAVAAMRIHGLDPHVREIEARPLAAPDVGSANQGANAAIVADLHAPAEAAAELRAIQYRLSARERLARFHTRATSASGFPLKRLDHLAALTRDIDASTRFWTDVMNVPLYGEVRTPATIIRQFRIGDAMLELLGASSPDSPAAQRQPGLANMAAFEVADMAAAVAEARAAGFTLADPGPGALPGTRVTTISGSQLSGFSLQLLEYV